MSVGRCDLSPGIQDDAPFCTRWLCGRPTRSSPSSKLAAGSGGFRRVKACKSVNRQGYRPTTDQPPAPIVQGVITRRPGSSFLLVRSPPSPNFPASPPPVVFSMLAIAFSPSSLPLAIVHSHELLHADLAADTRLVSSARR
ncbi:hypothetical protein E4U50_006805 [Claviceps purpurea]|nr:hypothetical protein E4U51_005528 [Claviceps purpurea]KAG6201220.1 hypothetical protein E4U50_006805 [Claviceps purpurea]